MGRVITLAGTGKLSVFGLGQSGAEAVGRCHGRVVVVVAEEEEEEEEEMMTRSVTGQKIRPRE